MPARFDYVPGPAFLASALINGDESSIESDADKATLAKFWDDLPAGASVEGLRDGERYFGRWTFPEPEGRLACDLTDYLVRLPADSSDGWDVVKARDLKPGDVLDLEYDPHAAGSDMAVSFEYETQPVIGTEREGADCVRVDFEGFSVGFPADHSLRRVRHDAALAASL